MSENAFSISVVPVENGWLIQFIPPDELSGMRYVSRDAAGVVEIIAQAIGVDAEVKRDAG